MRREEHEIMFGLDISHIELQQNENLRIVSKNFGQRFHCWQTIGTSKRKWRQFYVEKFKVKFWYTKTTISKAQKKFGQGFSASFGKRNKEKPNPKKINHKNYQNLTSRGTWCCLSLSVRSDTYCADTLLNPTALPCSQTIPAYPLSSVRGNPYRRWSPKTCVGT